MQKEYEVYEAIGSHPNILSMIEYHPLDPIYMATEYAKAKCLYHYLSFMSGAHTQTERWARYYFKQIINGLVHLHNHGLAHLDMKIDNVFLDIDEKF